MTSDAKRTAVACLAGLIILTAVIAFALPQLELKAGVPLPAMEGKAEPLVDSPPAPTISLSTLAKALIGVLIAAAVIFLSYKLLRGATWTWKDVFWALVSTGLLFLVTAGILLVLSRLRISTKPQSVEMKVAPPLEASGPPLGPVAPGLLWLVTLCLAAAIAGLGLWLFFWSRGRPDPLRLEAERALEALRTGADLKDVILRSYWQMTQVLKQEQGLEREAAMTTREFERLLGAHGVPAEPVHQLTQLFEAVRYGHRPPGTEEERQAVDCLTAIVRYSQRARPER